MKGKMGKSPVRKGSMGTSPEKNGSNNKTPVAVKIGTKDKTPVAKKSENKDKTPLTGAVKNGIKDKTPVALKNGNKDKTPIALKNKNKVSIPGKKGNAGRGRENPKVKPKKVTEVDLEIEDEEEPQGKEIAIADSSEEETVKSDTEDEPIKVAEGDLLKESSDVEEDNEEVEAEEEITKTFSDLGIVDALCEACTLLKWTKPTKIQCEAIPVALTGKDVIGLAETGSGKTGAFALPILQNLLEHPQRLFALVLTPTRELAFQIAEQFEALGARIGVKCAVIVGGIDMMTQALTLAKKPHIVVATPGRLVDHLENTKGFHLKSLKYLVMDEADRILNLDFEAEVDKILRVIPQERRTYMFSATMTKKVQKLQRASLKDPVKVEVSTKYKTVDKLQQHYLFIPLKFKDVYLVHILNELAGNSFMVFCATCANAMRTALMLRNLGFHAIPLHGQMSQNKRLASLNKFRAKNRSILISTDVASRGLDIPHVDVVINFDIPTHSKDYIHRVGRTARAGRAGKAITFVTQYDVELYQRIEHLIEKKLPLYKTEEEEVMVLTERVSEAQRFSKMEMKEQDDKKHGGKKRRGDDDDKDDTEESLGVRKRLKPNRNDTRGKKNFKNNRK